MIKCPKCGGNTGTIETRSSVRSEISYVRRRKECENDPAHRFSTIELAVEEGQSGEETIMIKRAMLEALLKPLVRTFSTLIGPDRTIDMIEQLLGRESDRSSS